MSVLCPRGGRILVASDRERNTNKVKEREGEMNEKNYIVYKSHISHTKVLFTIYPQGVYQHSSLPSGSLHSNESIGRVLFLAEKNIWA